MSFFNQASNFVIEKGTFVHNNVTSGGLHNLYQYTACGAMHDSKDQYDAPKCHPDTRKQLLSDTHEWIKIPDKETGIMFLHGPAGSGKSCIARSVCEEAAAKDLLGASFFFWRSASDRNSMNKLFTTIAYQLAIANNDLAKHIIAHVERDPRLVKDAPLEHQFRKLILEPCLAIPRDKLRATVIVIDGLDECIDQTMQIGILRLLAKAVRTDKFPLGFFITSRPESHIQNACNSKEIIFALQTISLDCVEGVSQDIRTVIQSGFSRILNDPNFKMALCSVARPWPPPVSVEKLVERSSGQFIYSATVMKFISCPNHNPDAQLQIVLGIKDSNHSSPLADLDLLYYEILSRVQDTERTMKVLGYVIVLKQPLAYSNGLLVKAITSALAYNQCRLLLVVEQLLGIPQGEAYFALNQLHSVLCLKVRSQSFRHKSEIKFHHRSFYDFLITKKRSTTFNLNRTLVYVEIARSCLKMMSLPKYETKEHHVGWVYAYFLWDTHISRISRTYGGLDIKLQTFDLALKRYFFGYSQILSLSLMKQAIDMLGLQNGLKYTSADKNAVQNLINHCSLSDEEHDNISGLATRNVTDRLKTADSGKVPKPNCSSNFDYVSSSFLFPMLHKHLPSYNNDSMVKQVLALFCIITYSGFYCGTNIVMFHGTESPFGLLFLKIERYISRFQQSELNEFLSTSQHSGIYHCTPDDYADAYIHLFSLPVWSDNYRFLFVQCVDHLEILKPAATPALMASLKSEALYLPSHTRNIAIVNQDPEWIHATVKKLLSWLKKLPSSPQDVIEAWEAVIKIEDPENEMAPWTRRSSGKIATQKSRNETTTSSKTAIESFLLACGVTPSESASLINR